MAYRIRVPRSPGYVLEFDTEAEFLRTLEVLGILNGDEAPEEDEADEDDPLPPVTPPAPVDRIRRQMLADFWERLNDRQRMLMDHLRREGDWVYDFALRGVVGVDGNQGLGAVVTSIGSHAEMAGLRREEVIVRDRSDGRDGSRYVYSIPPATLEMLPD